MEYEKLGLRVGLEIHQQLATEHKLFCSCPIKKSKEFPVEIKRKLRAVPGELGGIDPAALYEFLRDRIFVYKIDPVTSCLIETDDEPPRFNEEALKIGLQVCRLLNCEVPEEIHIMRKTVVDGSSVSAFQRTCLIGYNGCLDTTFGKIKIPSICLEEDSAPVVRKNGVIEYRLDRLGIPLVEVATSPDIHSPEQAREVAEKLGLLLRSCKVQRGIGSIRQDINISIEEGSRIEIKGFQELGKIESLIRNEVARQICLLEIKDELRKRGFSRINAYKDVTEIFKNTKCNFIRKAMENGRVLALLLPKFSGLLKKECGDRTFGKELSAYAEAYGFGIIHSDEDINKYQLAWEFQKLRDELKAGKEDLILIIAGKNPEKAMNAVLERAKCCIIGVPAETRVSDNTGSRYTRPLPGAERLYPETDVPPIRIDKRHLEKIEIPTTLIEREKELEKRLSGELATQIIKSRYYPLFEEFQKKFNIEPKLIANTFLSTMKDLRRKGFDTDKIKKEDLEKIFASVEKNSISRDSIPMILESLSKGEKTEDAIKSFHAMNEEELRNIISDIVRKSKDKNESALMGLVMENVRGRASGEMVLKILRKLSK